MRKVRRKRKLSSDINVVPYIDIMLVLLVVFMVTAPLFSQGYNVELPAVNSKPLQLNRQTQVVISITESGVYYYNEGQRNERLTLRQIQTKLQALQKSKDELEVFIKGDTKIQYGAVMTLMGSLQQSGIENVGLITQPEKGT